MTEQLTDLQQFLESNQHQEGFIKWLDNQHWLQTFTPEVLAKLAIDTDLLKSEVELLKQRPSLYNQELIKTIEAFVELVQALVESNIDPVVVSRAISQFLGRSR